MIIANSKSLVNFRGVFMNCRVVELRHKEVINCHNGCKIGVVDDVEVNTKDAKVVSIVIYGRPKFFGLLGRHDDFVIPWENIELIGEDAILVKCSFENSRKHSKKQRFFKVI